MQTEELVKLVETELDEAKGLEIKVIDVRGKTSITDYMIIATGTSGRHVKSLSSRIIELSKANGVQPIGVEGDNVCDWVLVDLGDLIVHLMLAQTREFYQLEKLWEGDYQTASDSQPG